MISVENFYWVLYENLLKPMEIDCWYYYPFGTTDNLSRSGEFRPWVPRQGHHALFHYDQEPIWNNNFGKPYDIAPLSWATKSIKLLANSEKSIIKKQVCRDRNMLDWYFFYHGFACLNWFRDSQYIIDQTDISDVFLSFNHLVRHRRSYRITQLARIVEANIMDRGTISFHGTYQDCVDEISDPGTQLSMSSQALFKKYISPDIQLPIKINKDTIDGTASAHFGHREYKLWQRSFVHLVNETVFYESKLHLTEKTFKPIVALRPFILAASPGNLEYLKSYGFKTFSDWWNEGYDSIQDHDDRLQAILQIVVDLCNRPFREIQEMLKDMQPILQYNKQHFFGDFRKIIVNELVDNFESCIRIWNNGRMDGREVLLNLDLDSIKINLLQ